MPLGLYSESMDTYLIKRNSKLSSLVPKSKHWLLRSGRGRAQARSPDSPNTGLLTTREGGSERRRAGRSDQKWNSAEPRELPANHAHPKRQVAVRGGRRLRRQTHPTLKARLGHLHVVQSWVNSFPSLTPNFLL